LTDGLVPKECHDADLQRGKDAGELGSDTVQTAERRDFRCDLLPHAIALRSIDQAVREDWLNVTPRASLGKRPQVMGNQALEQIPFHGKSRHRFLVSVFDRPASLCRILW